MNGWGGRKTNRKARLKRIRWKRRKNYQEKVKSPALQNRRQGTQNRLTIYVRATRRRRGAMHYESGRRYALVYRMD